MGLRFRQRIKIFPGVHLNVSLGGMSVSMGGPGATINIGKNMRVRGTVGIPGTGLSYQSTLDQGLGKKSNATRTPVHPDKAQQSVCGTDEPIQDNNACEAERLSGATWTPEALLPV